ncbi:MAG: HK97 family phage prohead protease [Armatimonadota bacterium]
MAVLEGPGSFAVTMPLAKVWEDEDGEMRFEGVASSTSLDRQQERMTRNAIKKMTEQTGLDVLPSHTAGPLEELGSVEEAWADNDQFRVAGRLDKSNPRARRLFEKVLGGRRYGLSVGGRVTKAFWRYDDEVGKQIRFIDDVKLDHVAVCRPEAAANPDTYLSVLAKAAEGVMEEAPDRRDEEAVLTRIGRAAVEATRALWPFANADDDGSDVEAGGVVLEDELAELAELRKSVEEALEELESALTELRKSEEKQEQDAPLTGRSMALSGQEMPEKGSMWRDVI